MLPQELTNWLWGRRYRVDTQGIAELTRHETLVEFIAWRDLRESGRTLRSVFGTKIPVRLAPLSSDRS
jgi:hypothetical protein